MQIATLPAGPGLGRIGIALCRGELGDSVSGGSWDRDLASDLDVVARWGAVAVIAPIEDHEFEIMQVRHLEAEVRRRHMDWLHLPIQDLSVPVSAFELEWDRIGEGLRARLRNGFDILVHCWGGLGRAGTIAARLLIELGASPQDAIDLVRREARGAIEAGAQEEYVRTGRPIPEHRPAESEDAIRDRATGALLGLAIGDAVGTTLEFKERDTYPVLTDMVGGGPFGREPGGWTDDTAMALALGTSLLGRDDIDEQDLLNRFWDWYQNGEYSCVGVCDDIGVTTREALKRWRRSGDPHSGSTDPNTAGNGSLMRLAPVAVRFWHDRAKLKDVAARQSKTTHGAPEAVAACVAYVQMLADAIEGKPRSEVFAGHHARSYAGSISGIIKGSWRGKPRREIRASGYVAHSLEAALWSIGSTGDFRSAILAAANLGDDADTTAAIAGQLAGALCGASALPTDWLRKLAWRDQIEKLAKQLTPHVR